MPDIFDEVQEDLRAERARALGRRYAGWGAALVVLILAATGGYVAWQQHSTTATNAVADRFIDAAQEADRAATPSGATDKQAIDAAEKTLRSLSAAAPAGYQVLARLRLAALQWTTGQQKQAIATWQSITDDAGAPALLRDLATLTSAQHQLDSGNPLLLRQRLESITGLDNPWRPMAELALALLDLRTGQPRDSAATLRRLTIEPLVPDGVRQMATALLTTLPPDATSQPEPPKAPPTARATPAGPTPKPAPTHG